MRASQDDSTPHDPLGHPRTDDDDDVKVNAHASPTTIDTHRRRLFGVVVVERRLQVVDRGCVIHNDRCFPRARRRRRRHVVELGDGRVDVEPGALGFHMRRRVLGDSANARDGDIGGKGKERTSVVGGGGCGRERYSEWELGKDSAVAPG